MIFQIGAGCLRFSFATCMLESLGTMGRNPWKGTTDRKEEMRSSRDFET